MRLCDNPKAAAISPILREERFVTLFGKILEYAARRALERKIHAEMATMTDAELNDLNLSRAKLIEMSRRQAVTA